MTLIELAERGWLPDFLIGWGIRQFDRKRLRETEIEDPEHEMRTLSAFLSEMRESPIALETHKANEQHYEVPAKFFEKIPGNHMKYSACYWPPGVKSLDEAETAMLELTLISCTPAKFKWHHCTNAGRMGGRLQRGLVKSICTSPRYLSANPASQ